MCRHYWDTTASCAGVFSIFPGTECKQVEATRYCLHGIGAPPSDGIQPLPDSAENCLYGIRATVVPGNMFAMFACTGSNRPGALIEIVASACVAEGNPRRRGYGTPTGGCSTFTTRLSADFWSPTSSYNIFRMLLVQAPDQTILRWRCSCIAKQERHKKTVATRVRGSEALTKGAP